LCAAAVMSTIIPGVFHEGTQAFILCAAVLMAVVVMAPAAIRIRKPDFRLKAVDLVFASTALLCTVSFALTSPRPGHSHPVYLVWVGFGIYLTVRVLYQRWSKAHFSLTVMLILGVSWIGASLGVIQLLFRSPELNIFWNLNYAAMASAMFVPVNLALLAVKPRRRFLKMIILSGLGVLLVFIVLARCRTAYLGLGVGLAVLGAIFFKDRMRSWARKVPIALRATAGTVGMGLIAAGLYGLYALKPVSVAGRGLIWKVSWRMFLDRPFFGVGFDGFAKYYNLYQAEYFRGGLGNALERLSASHTFFAFNDYIQTGVELGIIGMLVFGFFWVFVGCYTVAALRNGIFWGSRGGSGKIDGPVLEKSGKRRIGKAAPLNRYLTVGMAVSVLVYIIMACFYFAGRIIVLSVSFSALFACIVSAVEETRHSGIKLSEKAARFTAVGTLLALFLMTCGVLPGYFAQMKAERAWNKAGELLREHREWDALALMSERQRVLAWNGQFLNHYGAVLIDAGRAEEALFYLEKAKSFWPSPYVFENLATAHAIEGDAEEAVKQAELAAAMQPWRLHAEFLTASYYFMLGEADAALEHARRVIAIPMKIPTDRGGLLKQRARLMVRGLRGIQGRLRTRMMRAVSSLPGEYHLDVIRALIDAGDNAEALIAAIECVKGEELASMAFLIGHMPSGDLKILDADFMVNHVEYACVARNALPRNREVPEEIFLRYVLPYANLNESRDVWRPLLYNKFLVKVLQSVTHGETFLRLNHWVFVDLGIEFSNEIRGSVPQSPLESIEDGKINCYDGSILLCDSCRALGIPARVVVIPKWVDFDGSHAWVEIYERGKWQYLAAWDRSPLDRTWFTQRLIHTDASKPEHHIYAAVFEPTDNHLWFGPDVSFVDVTERYLEREASGVEN